VEADDDGRGRDEAEQRPHARTSRHVEPPPEPSP
jgi:hypothetical protein